MVEREQRSGADRGAHNAAAAAKPRSLDEARSGLEATRRRISRDLDDIEGRLRFAAGDIRQRLDLLEPARRRIRAEVWASVAVAFGAGVAYALLTAPRRNGRRGARGHVLRTTASRLPGAIFAGVRAGVADRLQQEWKGRRALPAAS